MSLDQMAAQIVMRARQIERAVHDPGPWAVVAGDRAFPARKVVGEDHVTFYAMVDVAHGGTMELHCGGDPVAIRLFDEPAGEFQVIWEFDVGVRVA